MIIHKIHLESFGKFDNKEIEFKPGINIVYGKNEKGKSTIHKFIEAIFFGLNEEYVHQKLITQDFSKYRPWRNPDVYKGSIEYEVDGKRYLVERDFLKEREGVTIRDCDTNEEISEEFDYDEAKGERKPLSKYWKLSRLSFLNVLGITDISNKTGKALIQEIKDRIVNIKNTNSGIISIEQLLADMEKAIEDISNDENVQVAYTSLEQLKAEEATCRAMMEEIRLEAKELFIRQEELDKLKQEEGDYLEKLHQKQAELKEERTKLLDELNEELDSITKQIESLEQFEDIEPETVEQYIENKKHLEINEEIIEEKSQELTKIKAKLFAMDPGVDYKVIMKIAGNKDAHDLVVDIEKLEDAKKERDDLDENIRTNEERLERSRQSKMEGNSIEASDLRLEEEYCKYKDIKNWKEYVEQNKTLHTFEKEEEEIKAAEDKKSKHFKLLIGSAVLFGLLIIAGIILFKFIFIFAGVSLIFLGLGIAQIIFVNKQKEIIRQVNNVIKHLKSENERTEKMLADNEQKLKKILERYNCSTQEEFEEYYKSRKSEISDHVINAKGIEMLKQKRDSLTVNINVLENKITKNIENLGLDKIIDIHDGEKAAKKIMELINNSQSYVQLKEAQEKLEVELQECIAETEAIKTQISNHNAIMGIENFNFEEIQSKKELLFQLQEKKKYKEEARDTLLKSMSDPSNEQSHEAVPTDDPEYNALANAYYEIKDKRTALGEDITELYHQILLKQNKARRLSDIEREYSYYERMIKQHEHQLEVYRYTLDTMKRLTTQIVDTFSSELKVILDEMLYKITNKYSNVVIDDELNILVEDNEYNKMVDIYSLSVGTIEQIYFALRVSLIQVVNRQIEIPLILDDCFIEYDIDRLTRVLKEIAKLNRQVILLSCHTRNSEVLTELEIPFNEITL